MEIGEAGRGMGNFENALLAVNDGANTPNLPERLGLENHVLKRKFLRKASGRGLIGWWNTHTVYISHNVRDDRGEVRSDVFRYPFRMQIVA